MNETLIGIRATIEELLTQIMYTTSARRIKLLSKAVKNLTEAYYELAESRTEE